MSESREQKLVSVNLRAADSTTEIFLIDRKLQVVKQGVGVLVADVPAGLYEVKLRGATSTFEEVIQVRSNVDKSYPALEFASPVPLDNTHKTHEYHVQNAQQHSHVNHVTLGNGSCVFIFARDWTSKTRPSEASGDVTSFTNPARGLSLRSASGQQLVDFEQRAVLGEERWDPWAACNVALDPGSYVLRLHAPDGTIWERTLVASPGWQSQCFLLQRFFGSEKAADIAGATVLMDELQRGFRADSHQVRMTELARLGLVKQRPVLSREMEELLHSKLENPMLGIFGAHLLLQLEDSRRRNYDRSFFSHVVITLRSLLRAPHPDVEALAWKAGLGQREFQFRLPPMLRRSWSLVTGASAEWPDAIPKDSISARICDVILAEEPWLVWAAEQASEGSDRIVETLALYISSANAQVTSSLEGASGGPPVDAADSVATMEAAAIPQMGSREADIRKLIEQLAIPRALVEEHFSAAVKKAAEIRQQYAARPRRGSRK